MVDHRRWWYVRIPLRLNVMYHMLWFCIRYLDDSDGCLNLVANVRCSSCRDANAMRSISSNSTFSELFGLRLICVWRFNCEIVVCWSFVFSRWFFSFKLLFRFVHASATWVLYYLFMQVCWIYLFVAFDAQIHFLKCSYTRQCCSLLFVSSWLMDIFFCNMRVYC